MKLLKLHIIAADTCGGLLNGLKIPFRQGKMDNRAFSTFSPLCLIGPNGTGKSQVLQIIAEIFQAVFRFYLPEKELGEPNKSLLFELEYLIHTTPNDIVRVHISRKAQGKKKAVMGMAKWVDDDWVTLDDNSEIETLLPSKVVGYTSGDNETLSLPFLVSRSGYADQVRTNAITADKRTQRIEDPRMLLIDYGTNLEVLVANLLLNPDNVRKKLLAEPNLKELRSFRCVVQLNHTAAPGSKGVLLTQELQGYVDYLKKCATCYDFNPKSNSYIFDFFVTSATHQAFGHHWPDGALALYACFHKLAMLNDLVIPKAARDSFKKGVKNRRFAARLPEPFEADKVFRFERVAFISQKSDQPVDYVSLSDGEHQLAQLLGTVCMTSSPNVLFLLDEPESHFNPRWRVEFISKILDLPTRDSEKEAHQGKRSALSAAALQDCLLTTHSPFVPSDMKADNVLIFAKDDDEGRIKVRRPNIETYGSTFDTILEECFEISPPMSDIPKAEIEHLLKSDDIDEIKAGMKRLGDSVERMYLADRIRVLKRQGGQ